MERMPARRGKRDASVELLRIIGACMVIGTHIRPRLKVNGALALDRVWIACAVGDGVAVFWMILGFFYFARTDARARLMGLLKRVVVPMAAFTVFMFFFYDFIVKGATLSQSLGRTLADYKAVVKMAALHWHSETQGTGHFWYLWIYILAVLAFPAMKGARDALTGDWARERRLLAIMLGLLAYNDLTGNDFFNFTHHTFGGLLGAAMWILTGDILYRNREKLPGGAGMALAGLGAAVAANAARTLVQYGCLLRDPENNELMFWYSSFAYVRVIALGMFAFGLSGLWARRERLARAVVWLGSRTFGVYVWHLAVVEKLEAMGVKKWIARRLCASVPGTLLYMAAYTLLVFLISLALAEAASLLWRGARRLWRVAFPSFRADA